MKVVCRLILILFLAAPVFAQNDEAESGSPEALHACINAMKDIFTQSATLDGKNGIRVTCTLMPDDEIAAVAWEIENPNGILFTIREADLRLSSGGTTFAKITTEQATVMLDQWPNETRDRTESESERHTPADRPGDLSREDLMYQAAFPYGSTSDADVSGMTYFACRLKDLPDATASITINGETITFTFDGGGP